MTFKLLAVCFLWQLLSCESAMQLKLLDAALVESSGARCLDGSRAGYYFEQGAVTDKWVISIEGGGLCLENRTCTARSQNSLGSSKFFTPQLSGRTVFSSDPLVNPSFWNWSRVHIPYCSGDLWTGTRKTVDPIETFGLYFAGHLIVEGVIQDVIDNYNIEDAAEIVIRGGSAGALGGVTSNIDWLNEKFPSAKISGIMNAGWFTDFTPSWNGPSFPEKLAIASQLYQSRVNEACAAANPTNATFCLFPRYAWEYVPNRLFSQNSMIDTSMLNNLGFEGSFSDPDAGDYLISLGHYTNTSIYTDFVRDPLIDGLFLTTCLMHGLDDAMVIKGRAASDAIYNWYYGIEGAPRVTYDECTIESVIALILTNRTLLEDCPTVMTLCEKVASPNAFERAIEAAFEQPMPSPISQGTPMASGPASATPVTSASSSVTTLVYLVALASAVNLF